MLDQLEQGNAAVRASHSELARIEFDIDFSRLKHMRRNLEPVLYNLLGGMQHNRAAGNLLGPTGALARNQLVAIALYKAEPIERYTELRSNDLRERCCMTLSVIKRARDHRHRASSSKRIRPISRAGAPVASR